MAAISFRPQWFDLSIITKCYFSFTILTINNAKPFFICSALTTAPWPRLTDFALINQSVFTIRNQIYIEILYQSILFAGDCRWIRLKFILNSNIVKCRLPITYLSFSKLFDRNGSYGQTIFCESYFQNEFWGAIIHNNSPQTPVVACVMNSLHLVALDKQVGLVVQLFRTFIDPILYHNNTVLGVQMSQIHT